MAGASGATTTPTTGGVVAKRVDVIEFLQFEQSNERMASRKVKGAKEALEALRSAVQGQEMVLVDEETKNQELRKKILALTNVAEGDSVRGSTTAFLRQNVGLVKGKMQLVESVHSELSMRIELLSQGANELTAQAHKDNTTTDKALERANFLAETISQRVDRFNSCDRLLASVSKGNEKKVFELQQIHGTAESAKGSLHNLDKAREGVMVSSSQTKLRIESLRAEIASTTERLEARRSALLELNQEEASLSTLIQVSQSHLTEGKRNLDVLFLGISTLENEQKKLEQEKIHLEQQVQKEFPEKTTLATNARNQLEIEIQTLNEELAHIQTIQVPEHKRDNEILLQNIENAKKAKLELVTQVESLEAEKVTTEIEANLLLQHPTAVPVTKTTEDLEKESAKLVRLNELLLEVYHFGQKMSERQTEHEKKMAELAAQYHTKVTQMCDPVEKEIEEIRRRLQE